jgi:hypothetical protein
VLTTGSVHRDVAVRRDVSTLERNDDVCTT